MPSLAPITVTTAWVAVQSGPFTGRISNLSGAQLYIRVATGLPTGLDGAVPLAVGMSVQLASGETLYARAYDRPGAIQVDPELITVASPPLNLMTSKGGPYARLRVDPDQTSFWGGLQYRTFSEISIPQGTTAVFKVLLEAGEYIQLSCRRRIYRVLGRTPDALLTSAISCYHAHIV